MAPGQISLQAFQRQWLLFLHFILPEPFWQRIPGGGQTQSGGLGHPKDCWVLWNLWLPLSGLSFPNM